MGKYLQHRNWQMVQIRAPSTSAEPLFNFYQHPSGHLIYLSHHYILDRVWYVVSAQ